ncbi:Ldh family oxidoreductase [Pigmentiphaga soli]|uniref:Ldh family oxidoreductase n=1 Tax=Pigmentiphaga soli TaxID=1007095 RepID=A0ABP8GLK9_9BURK
MASLVQALFEAGGTPPARAAIVARHLVGANLAGHESHGIIRVPDYLDRVKRGHIVPGAEWKIDRETPSTLVVDGGWGFGYVVTEEVTARLIEKARTTQVAAATVYRQGHIGRLAGYTLQAARAGMIGLITADSGRSPKQVAPFGGAESRLGTNPISIAVPSDLDGPLFIDIATSAVAGGKVSLALARGQSIPLGWVVDSDGNQTTDPARLKKGGSLLPLGGPEGHKGYGLAVIVEVLCGLLTGLGFGVEPTGKHNDGCFVAVFNVEAFRPLHTFTREVADFARYLKATKPAQGFDEVLYPGELEHRAQTDREANGVPVDDKLYERLANVSQEYGLAGRFERLEAVA